MRLILISVGTLALAACAQTTAEPAVQEPAPQRCDAAASGKDLIGTNVAAVSFPSGANVRIVCTTCPTTKDLRPDRLNVRFEQATGIIRSVDCG